MWIQKEVNLQAYPRGFHLISRDILREITEIESMNVGLVNILLKHTSASLTINENADPSVRADFESYFNQSVPENEPYYRHVDEGSDDMPAHIKASILGPDLNIPITNGHLNLGIWQGIYLCEHRNHGGSRQLVITIQGE